MSLAHTLVASLASYLGLGLAVAVPFALFGVGRAEPTARGGSLLFRVLIVPGCTLLWPLCALRWMRAARGRAT